MTTDTKNDILADIQPELRLVTAVELVRHANRAGDAETARRALAFIRSRAADDDYECKMKISMIYEYGDGVPKDTHESGLWSRSIFDKKISHALQLCQKELADLNAMKRHLHSTFNIATEFATEGHPNCAYLAALMLMQGVGVAQDVDNGLDLLLKAAEHGQVDAQYELGRFYGDKFKYSQKDTRVSLYWYDKAVSNGDSRALIDLAYTYFEGDDAVPRDYDKAFMYAKLGAEQGDKYCQHIVGDLFLRGRGTTRDPNAAIHWLSKAGEQGFSMAIEELAVLFFKGFGGVSQNYENAYYWCKKGAEVWPSGLGYCQAVLGDMYRNGYGVKQDLLKAFDWYQKAANQHNSTQSYAQYILGEIYLKGEGIPKDRVKAIQWFQIAADTGYEAARRKLERIKSTDEDINGLGQPSPTVSLPSRPNSPQFLPPPSPTTPAFSSGYGQAAQPPTQAQTQAQARNWPRTQSQASAQSVPAAVTTAPVVLPFEKKTTRWSLGLFGNKKK